MGFFSGFMVQNPQAQPVNIDNSALIEAMNSINQQRQLQAQQDQNMMELNAKAALAAAVQQPQQNDTQQQQGLNPAQQADLLLKQLGVVQNLQNMQQNANTKTANAGTYAGLLDLQNKMLDSQTKQAEANKAAGEQSFTVWHAQNPDATLEQQLAQAQSVGATDTLKSVTQSLNPNQKLGGADAKLVALGNDALSNLKDLHDLLQTPEFQNLSKLQRLYYDAQESLLPIPYQSEFIKTYSSKRAAATESLLRMVSKANLPEDAINSSKQLLPNILNSNLINQNNINDLTTFAKDIISKTTGLPVPQSELPAQQPQQNITQPQYNQWY